MEASRPVIDDIQTNEREEEDAVRSPQRAKREALLTAGMGYGNKKKTMEQLAGLEDLVCLFRSGERLIKTQVYFVSRIDLAIPDLRHRLAKRLEVID